MRHAIILAAGKGTRMHSELPKCAHLVLGKPMINHVVDACIDAGIEDIVVVVGYKKEEILALLDKYSNVRFAIQDEQLGTGHAVKCTKHLLKNETGSTVILPGDMPLIGSENIKELLKQQEDNHNAMTILTALFDNPFSYGRIVRNMENNVVGIVEEKEATDEQKLIKEVNTGLYVVDNKLLFESLELVNNNNNKHEYYLTDIVGILSNNYKVGSKISVYDYRLMGINDIDTLNKVEYLAQRAQ